MQYDPLSDAFTHFQCGASRTLRGFGETSKQTTRTDVANNAEVWIRRRFERIEDGRAGSFRVELIGAITDVA